MEQCSGSSNNNETGNELDCQSLSPVSFIESSLESGSCADNRSSVNGIFTFFLLAVSLRDNNRLFV